MREKTRSWLEAMLTAAEKRGIDTSELLHVTRAQGDTGWWVDQVALEDLLLDWLGRQQHLSPEARHS